MSHHGRMATPHEHVTAALRASGISRGSIEEVLGLHRISLSDRMRGRTRWTLEECVELADLLGTTVDELVGPREVSP